MELKLYYDGTIEGLQKNAVDTVEGFIRQCEYVVIGTMPQEAGVRLSALNNLPGQKVDELWFSTGLTSQKARNLLFNPICEVFMTNGNGQLMLGGGVEIIIDPELKKEKWQPFMEPHLKTPENEDYCLLKLTPTYIRVMLM